MLPVAPINPDIQRLIIEKHLDYQLALVNRRWQYFAAYILLNGLLFNVWKDVGLTQVTLVTLLSAGGVLVALVLLQLTSLASKRIEKSQVYLLQVSATVFDYPLDGRLDFLSETLMLYIAFITISLGWFYLLFLADQGVFWISAVVFTLSLTKLQWRTLRRPTVTSGVQ